MPITLSNGDPLVANLTRIHCGSPLGSLFSFQSLKQVLAQTRCCHLLRKQILWHRKLLQLVPYKAIAPGHAQTDSVGACVCLSVRRLGGFVMLSRFRLLGATNDCVSSLIFFFPFFIFMEYYIFLLHYGLLSSEIRRTAKKLRQRMNTSIVHKLSENEFTRNS